MITITKHPSEYSFYVNPVVFEVLTDTDDPVSVDITIAGKTYSTTYYPFKLSQGSYKISMNLSDFLRFDNAVTISDAGIISPIQGFSVPFQVKIGTGYIFNGKALRGGISNEAFRKLDENGMDMFTFRLATSSEQFLFTTRTNGKEIRIRKAELFPFVFRHPGVPIVFRNESGTQTWTPAQAAGTFCVMNIQNVLKQLTSDTKLIGVFPNDVYAFNFVLISEKLSEEKYLLKFRNSLGAFEMVEVTGRAMHAPEFAEENLWQTMSDFDFYEERRSRIKAKGVIEVETGYRECGEFPFITDLIQSDEVYFIYPDGDSFRCHVKADSVQYRNLMTEPTSVKLKIRMITDEEFTTPKIDFSPEEVSIIADPNTVEFFGTKGSKYIKVKIKAPSDSYSIIGIPSWMSVSDKTKDGFYINVDENPTSGVRTAKITVQIDWFPDVKSEIDVLQQIWADYSEDYSNDYSTIINQNIQQ